MFDLKGYLSEQAGRVNQRLDQLLPDSKPSSRIVEAMRYALMAGGKRIRPVLCLASAQVISDEDSPAIMTVACALEMIHTYSLIHDDLPAMDDDELRRGKKTCHIAFDEATAILAGDALLTAAFDVLSSIPCREPAGSHDLLKVINVISRAAGYRGMIEGQMRDMAAEGRRISLKDLEAGHLLKTGALIEAAVFSGACLAGADREQIEKLMMYAKNIGLAFQVADDILDIEGDADIIGKAVGADACREKNTYPSLMGLEPSKAYAKKLIDRSLEALSDFEANAEPLRAIARYIIERKK